eukprot:GHVS01089391.1.p1 GENE.GHVS01089391.1~~GHVS01089391.1.p1  ORF type:complete len:107 (+),score=4.41 GHVS01089391.1:423-743(+)
MVRCSFNDSFVRFFMFWDCTDVLKDGVGEMHFFKKACWLFPNVACMFVVVRVYEGNTLNGQGPTTLSKRMIRLPHIWFLVCLGEHSNEIILVYVSCLFLCGVLYLI